MPATLLFKKKQISSPNATPFSYDYDLDVRNQTTLQRKVAYDNAFISGLHGFRYEIGKLLRSHS
jgi:hypothetical protein